MNTTHEILNMDQVADMLGISVRTLQRHIAESNGQFPGRQIGSKWVFDKQQIIEWVRNEWEPESKKQTQLELIEEERKRWGIDLPETLVALQQYASRKEK